MAADTENIQAFLDTVANAVVYGAESLKVEHEKSQSSVVPQTKRTRTASGWLAKLREEKSKSNNVREVLHIRRAAKILKPGYLRLKNYGFLTNRSSQHRKAVTNLGIISKSVDYDLAWSVSLDCKIMIYSLKPTRKEVLSTILIERTPICGATLSGNNQSLICLADGHDLLTVDLESRAVSRLPPLGHKGDKLKYKSVVTANNVVCVLDDTGCIHQLDERCNKVTRKLNSGTHLTSMIFINDDTVLAGDECGEIFWWSVNSSKCSKRVKLPASLGIRTLTKTSSGLLAVGDTADVITLHNLQEPSNVIKTFKNVEGPAEVLVAHPNCPLLIAGNSMSVNNSKMFNVAEAFTFQNWPPRSMSAGHMTSATMSCRNGWTAVGNGEGFIHLWQMLGNL